MRELLDVTKRHTVYSAPFLRRRAHRTHSAIHAIRAPAIRALPDHPERPFFIAHRMKPILAPALFALALSASMFQLVAAQEAPDLPEDYSYLAKLHVPDAVAQCVAAFDRWVENAPKYDTLIVPDRRVLSAKIDDDTPIFSVGNPIPVDKVIVMRAFAKARGTAQWTRVDSRCGVRDGHVVGVSLTPNMKPKIVR
ncbi:hypothetical protein AWB78_02148 [Caballeronia calidae]|uniref:Uncharacterized protein n=2 Tax=Caballeronia calidae TaxID=1777139 RepID=A0A158AZP3_9BURK|nr:hypothetical protein AWB78_02148 [Caballeronia calidae]